MARASALLAVFFFFMLMPVNPSAEGQVLCKNEADDIAALRMFDRGVNAYVELHRRLEAPLFALRISSDPEAVAAAATKLAEAIRAERPGAMQGDIFGPEVGDLFRVRMRAVHALLERGTVVPAAGLDGEDGVPCTPLPVVNARFAWADSVPIGDALTRALPVLPREIEYRLTAAALVLVDVRADLVVDLLELP